MTPIFITVEYGIDNNTIILSNIQGSIDGYSAPDNFIVKIYSDSNGVINVTNNKWFIPNKKYK